MYGDSLVPDEFDVPDRLDGPGYHLRMLSIGDVERDFEAVVESAWRLKGLFGPDSSWPEGLTREDNLIDLAWHQREFTLRRSFAYTVMAEDESRCLGCVYVFPSRRRGFDAAVFYWARSGADAELREAELGARVRTWLASRWPFRAVAYPGRDPGWEKWCELPLRQWS